MKDENNPVSQRRQYPPFYEKVVPVTLAVLVVAAFAMLIIILGVALGLFPGVG